jgi:hypothetical protein
MAEDIKALLTQGKELARKGDRARARQIFEQITEQDAYNEDAWVWLAAVVDTVEEQQICLENVLLINPNNAKAKAGLQALEGKAASDPAPGASTSAKQEAPPRNAPASKREETLDDLRAHYDQPVTATSSASSTYAPPEPPVEEYDSWIQGLNLGNKPGAGGGGGNVFTADPDEVDFDDDGFGGAFNAQFGFDDANGDDDADLLADFDDPFSANTEAEPPRKEARGPFSVDLALDDLRGIADERPPARAAGAVASSPQSPGSGLTPGKSPARQAASSGGLYAGGETLDDIDPGEYFLEIPPDIRPTRLPGTDEKYPPLLVIGVIVLVLLNLGAVALIALRLNT